MRLGTARNMYIAAIACILADYININHSTAMPASPPSSPLQVDGAWQEFCRSVVDVGAPRQGELRVRAQRA